MPYRETPIPNLGMGLGNYSVSLESLDSMYGPLMFTKCCRYWPIHTAHLARGVGRCPVCRQEMKLVTDEQEVQRLRHTAAELAEGPSVRVEGREPYIRFLIRYIKWFVRGKNGQVPEWAHGRGNTTATRSPWELD